MRKFSSKQIGIGATIGAVAIGIIYFAASGQASKPAAPPAPQVSVQSVEPQKVRVWSEFSGRLHAVDSADIHPEVNGRITEIRFQDGAYVKAGDVIMVIDPRPYQAAVAKARAEVAAASTNLNFAKVEESRAAGMMKTQAIAQRIYDERANSNRVASAALQVASAQLKQADIDLEHAYVRAPISGRIGRPELTVGNLVQAGPNSPLLTTIVSNGTIYADFDVDEQAYLQNIRSVTNEPGKERQVPVEMHVQGDKSHPYKGTIYSFDNHIDLTSGTIRARAKFNNSDGALIPGMFVSVSLGNGADTQALLVPEQALGFDQDKKFVYVVDKDNKVIYREVKLGKQVNGQRIVLSGLATGERIIVDGVQHVRPDVIVEAKDVSLNQIAPAEGAAKTETPQTK